MVAEGILLLMVAEEFTPSGTEKPPTNLLIFISVPLPRTGRGPNTVRDRVFRVGVYGLFGAILSGHKRRVEGNLGYHSLGLDRFFEPKTRTSSHF